MKITDTQRFESKVVKNKVISGKYNHTGGWSLA